MGLSENVVYPIYPMVLLIIIPIKWLFHWEYTLFSDKPTYTKPDRTDWCEKKRKTRSKKEWMQGKNETIRREEVTVKKQDKETREKQKEKKKEKYNTTKNKKEKHNTHIMCIYIYTSRTKVALVELPAVNMVGFFFCTPFPSMELCRTPVGFPPSKSFKILYI